VESIGAGMLAKSAALLKVFVQNLLQDRHTLSAMRTCAGNYATPQAAYRVASTFISPVVAA
jgi:UDP-N-acetylglucosamine:LPS N-acetylglucosamine transferase